MGFLSPFNCIELRSHPFDPAFLVAIEIAFVQRKNHFNSAIEIALAFALNDHELEIKLKKLREQLCSSSDQKERSQWWKSNRGSWDSQLRKIMIEHRNAGHDWQFSESQKELLQNYYDANKLLVDCLKSECYANRQVLQRIEDTLLLPFEN